MKTIRIWVPADQDRWGPPRTIARGGQPPQPGQVFDVQAPSAKTAIQIVALATAPEPDRKQDAYAWARWANAQDSVAEVADVTPTREQAK